MKLPSLLVAALLPAFPASAIPLLTLTQLTSTSLQWSWDDGTGSGIAVGSPERWEILNFPMPTGVTDSFYGRWDETFPGYRNDVYFPFVAPGLGTLYVSTDIAHLSGPLVPQGVPIDSYVSQFQVVFIDKAQHLVDVPDAGPNRGMIMASLALILVVARRASKTSPIKMRKSDRSGEASGS